MIQENNARYNIWKQLANPFDYTTFCVLCQQADLTPMDGMDFAFKVGRFMVANQLYSDLHEIDAYKKLADAYPLQNLHPFAHRPAEATPSLTSEQFVPTSPCCGGGVTGESRGLGDTVAKITHTTRLDKLSALYTHITGKPCGCADRQEALNKLFPYGVKEEI